MENEQQGRALPVESRVRLRRAAPCGRRQWISDVLRASALAGIALLTGGLGAKRCFVEAQGECRVGRLCAQCPASADCRWIRTARRTGAIRSSQEGWQKG